MTDARIERRLAAILAADVVGFSALMERDEEGTYARIGRLRREVIEPRLSEHQGRLIKTTGDGFLAEFASPIAALRCALAIQNSSSNAPDAFRLRIGLNLGDVIIEEGGDVYGEGVNVAARLEALADANGILISDKIHREVEGKVEAAFEDRGEQQVKNITRPIRIYAVRSAGAASTSAATSLSQFDPGKPLPLPDKPSIAVLPFQNMSGDPEQEYFADGIVEDIITALSRVKWFFVIARNSSFTYKGRAVDVRQVGRELGVRYVLEGSIRKSSNRVRITGQLIEAATGNHVWADRFEGSLEDIFELQDRITETVVAAIEPSLQLAEIRRSSFKPTDSLQAYDFYLRALAAFNLLTRSSLETTLAECRHALAIDPTYASAHGLVAWCLVWRDTQNWISDRIKERAEALKHARLAIDFGANDPTALWMAGHAIAYSGGGNEQGYRIVERSLVLNPNSAPAWNASGLINYYLGNGKIAVDHFKRAMRLSPVDPLEHLSKCGVAFAYFAEEQYGEAVDWADRALTDQPKFLPSLRIKAAACALLGRVEDARATARLLLAAAPELTLRDVPNRYSRASDSFAYIDGLRKAGVPE